MYHHFSMTQIIEHLKAPGRKNFILDTDAYNEIDDQFAITYAMLSDNIKLLALTSAPFFNRRVRSVSEGQQKSFEEMTRIRDLIDPEGERNIPCYHGADGYLPDIHTPCPSEAVENIIRIVKEADGIVYFGMLGCFTNMASALLTEPSIREKVVVIMIGANRFGYHTNNEFNLMQDRAAARVILECGVPVVVLPAMEATERITTTTGEVYYYLKGKTGNIGNYLCKIYAEDEWVPDDAEGNCSSSQRSLWDLAAVALLRLADQIGDLQIVPAKTISQDGVLWVELGDGQQMLYVDQFNRNRIMSDFFTTLRKAYL